MSLEGRKFHFATDDDGKIYAQYEIETEVANREGWLLPPRKGDKKIEYYLAIYGTNRVEIIYETTGDLKDDQPVYNIASTRVIEDKLRSTNDYLSDGLLQTITNFSVLLRSVYDSSQDTAIKLLRAVNFFMVNGWCMSNADEDSVCGGICETCRE